MPLFPGMPNPPGDVALTDLKSNREWIFSLETPPQITSLSQDNSIFIRNVAKRVGDFDEQRDWRMGRGWEEFSKQPAGCLDSMNAWTMGGQVHQTIQFQFARGLRATDFELRGSKAWRPLSSTQYVSRKFTASASYDGKHIYLWIRRRGYPGTMTVEFRNDNAGKPGSTIHKTIQITTANVTDTLSVLYDFVLSTVYSLVDTTVYHIVAYGDTDDNEANHWEVAVKEGGSDSHTSPDGSTWTAATFSMYYRITDADPNRTLYGFNYDGSYFAVSSYYDGTASKLYINGDRRVVASATANTITVAGTPWVVDRFIGAWVRVIRNTGKGQIRQITDNTTSQLVLDRDLDIVLDATSEISIYGTDWFQEVTLSPALGVVVNRPAILNGVIYFPQGTGTNILRAYWDTTTHAWVVAADGTNKADILLSSYIEVEGPVMYRANNAAGAGSGGAVTISRSKAPALGSNLSFAAAQVVGDTTYLITNMTNHDGQVWIFKEDGPWFILNDKPYNADFGMDATPSPTNGVAAVSKNKLLYFNWLWSTERLFSGQLDDIGQDWRGVGLPDDRQGAVMQYEPVVGWLFKAVDAGVNGTSSVMCWDGLAEHEVLRAYTSSKRIRAIKWQPCEGTRSRLWTEIAGDYVYQEFPLNNANPLNDSGVVYQQEFAIVSPTIDMGEASGLPKFWRSMTAIADNLGELGTIEFDYQLDDDVGTATWNPQSSFDVSPESEIFVWEGDIRKFRYRARGFTFDETKPTILRQIRPNGFARTPFRLIWNLSVRLGDISTPSGQMAPDPSELARWLWDVARYPGCVKMTSTYYLLHDFYVVIPPPNFVQLSEDQPAIPWQGSGALSLMEA